MRGVAVLEPCYVSLVIWTRSFLVAVPLLSVLACASGPTARVAKGTPGELICSFVDDPEGRRFELTLESGTESSVTGMSIGEYDEAGNVVGVVPVERFAATPASPWPQGTYAGTWRGQPVSLTIDGVAAGLFEGEASLVDNEPSTVRCDFLEYTATE